MVYFVIVASILGTWVLVGIRRSLIQRGLRKAWSYRLTTNLLTFTAPCAAVSAFFLLLLLRVRYAVGSDTTTLQSLLRIEQLIIRARAFVGVVKLDALQTLVVLAGFLLLSVVAASLASKLLRVFSRLQSVIRFIYICVVLLSAFTLFGNQLGTPSNQLRLRITTLRQGYSDLKADLSGPLTEAAVRAIFERQMEALPPAYKEALRLPQRVDEAARNLASAYESAQRDYQLSDAWVAAALARIPAEAGGSDIIVAMGTAVRTETAGASGDAPAELTYGRLREAEGAAKAIADERSSPDYVNMLELEAGRKVVCQIPRVITGGLKKAAFESALRECPILEPLVDAFVRAVDQEVEARINAAIDRAARRAVGNPGSTGNAIQTEAAWVATDHEAVAADVASSARAEEQLRSRLSTLSEATAELDGRVKAAKCDHLLEQLSSDFEGDRTSAVEELVEHASELTSAQSERLLDIMRNGTDEWEVFVDQRWEGSYCYKRFRMKSIREYAAEAVERGSPGGSKEAAAARAAKSEETERISYYTRTYI